MRRPWGAAGARADRAPPAARHQSHRSGVGPVVLRGNGAARLRRRADSGSVPREGLTCGQRRGRDQIRRPVPAVSGRDGRPPGGAVLEPRRTAAASPPQGASPLREGEGGAPGARRTDCGRGLWARQSSVRPAKLGAVSVRRMAGPVGSGVQQRGGGRRRGKRKASGGNPLISRWVVIDKTCMIKAAARRDHRSAQTLRRVLLRIKNRRPVSATLA